MCISRMPSPIVIDLARREAAYGERWIIPGAGALTLRRTLEVAGAHLGCEPRALTAGPWLPRILTLFMPGRRAFMPMVAT